jgi:hypothetical protein
MTQPLAALPTLKIRYLYHPADFCKSEATNYAAFMAANAEYASQLRRGDAVMLLNRLCTQAILVHGFSQIEDPRSINGTRQVLYSQRMRLTNGAFSPDMLKDAGLSIGFNLVGPGLRAFKELHDEWERARNGG